ncbi:transcription termination factor Rho [Peptoniphilaceae bacterium SGI.137]
MNHFSGMKLDELKSLAKEHGLAQVYKYKKNELLSWLNENVKSEDSAKEQKNKAPADTQDPANSSEEKKPAAKKRARRGRSPKKQKEPEAALQSKKTLPSEVREGEPKAHDEEQGSEATHSKDAAEKPKAKRSRAKGSRSKKKEAQKSQEVREPEENPLLVDKSPENAILENPLEIPEDVRPDANEEDSGTFPERSVSEGAEEFSNQEHQANPETASDEETHSREHRNLPSRSGVLEVMTEGYGFLHCDNEDGSRTDFYMPAQQIKRFSLRSGDIVEGIVGDTRERDRYAPIIYLNLINGIAPTDFRRRDDFDDLTPIYPNERIRLERGKDDISNRIVDLVAPIGRGQRGLIVSPPKAGKTTLLKSIAHAIEARYPEIYLFVLLIDERPEEVTDFVQSVNRTRKEEDPIRTEVVSSTFDKQAQNHTRTAEELLDRAKRLVESGQDVVILLDSLTRLSRAYNITTTPSGRTLSGGMDPVALYPPKRFFGAARNISGAGSLTVLATCLRDTGSRMDDMIYEEFKGTGNMEVHLSRNLSELRIFPAIDIFASGTRRDDLLLDEEERGALFEVRRQGRTENEPEMMAQFVRLIRNTDSNKEFCDLVLKNKKMLPNDSASHGRIGYHQNTQDTRSITRSVHYHKADTGRSHS